MNEFLDIMSPMHSAGHYSPSMKYNWYCGLDDGDGLTIEAPNEIWGADDDN